MSEWISVADKLPKAGTRCLSWRNDAEDKGTYYAVTTSYGPGRFGWCYAISEIKAGVEVTHWMPLPDPPEDAVQ